MKDQRIIRGPSLSLIDAGAGIRIHAVGPKAIYSLCGKCHQAPPADDLPRFFHDIIPLHFRDCSEIYIFCMQLTHLNVSICIILHSIILGIKMLLKVCYFMKNLVSPSYKAKNRTPQEVLRCLVGRK